MRFINHLYDAKLQERNRVCQLLSITNVRHDSKFFRAMPILAFFLTGFFSGTLAPISSA